MSELVMNENEKPNGEAADDRQPSETHRRQRSTGMKTSDRAVSGDLAAIRCALDRRAFLRLAGGAAALGLCPSGCGPGTAALAPPPGVVPVSFTPRSYAVFNAAAARIVGPRGAELIRERRIDPARRVDRLLARAPDVAGSLQQALLVVEFAIFPVLEKLRPFTALDGPAQDAVLAELMHSRFETKRAIFAGLKGLACLGFYGDPGSNALTGYPGPFGSDRVSIADAMTYDLER